MSVVAIAPASILAALDHFDERLPIIAATDSRHRPHWTTGDIAAAAALLVRPASREQIALARIEGLTSFVGYGNNKSELERVHRIARGALGFQP